MLTEIVRAEAKQKTITATTTIKGNSSNYTLYFFCRAFPINIKNIKNRSRDISGMRFQKLFTYL